MMVFPIESTVFRRTAALVLVFAAVFGGVHTLNALITGSLGAAVAQAVMASLFGVWACAVRLRTGSVVPMIGFHWMWDCLLVLGGVGVGLAALVAAPLLFLWGLRLLRGVEEPRVGPPGAAPPEAIGDRPHVSPGETPASQSGASRV